MKRRGAYDSGGYASWSPRESIGHLRRWTVHPRRWTFHRRQWRLQRRRRTFHPSRCTVHPSRWTPPPGVDPPKEPVDPLRSQAGAQLLAFPRQLLELRRDLSRLAAPARPHPPVRTRRQRLARRSRRRSNLSRCSGVSTAEIRVCVRSSRASARGIISRRKASRWESARMAPTCRCCSGVRSRFRCRL